MGIGRAEYLNQVLTIRDSVMSAQSGTTPWEQFPMQAIEDPGTGFSIYDDFCYNNSASTNLLWQIVKGTGGSIALANKACGWIDIPTAASNHDYQALFTQEPEFFLPPVAGYLAAWEIMLNVTEANTNTSNWWAGFTSVTTTGFISNTGTIPASFSGAVIYKTEGTLNVSAATSNATIQNITSSAITTAVSGTSLILGMGINTNDGTTAICTYYVSTVASNVRTFVTSGALNLTLASLTHMYFGFGVNTASANAETLTVDYVQAAQGRYYQ